MTPAIADEIEHYLRTGRTDVRHAAWAGTSLFDRAAAAHRDLRSALVVETCPEDFHELVSFVVEPIR